MCVCAHVCNKRIQRTRRLRYNQARKHHLKWSAMNRNTIENGKRCKHCEFLKDAVCIVDAPQIRCGNHVVEYLPKRRARCGKTTTAGIRNSENVITIIA